ncbi:MAG TPA: hypothetical protein VE956_08925 [Nodularia sp. (in: cyanobacteria)]|nr:hypothetical protein [Nodularia sp. (in: cyanobacteria)]
MSRRLKNRYTELWRIILTLPKMRSLTEIVFCKETILSATSVMPQAIRSPTPQTLHWLAAGQLANRLHRAIRHWWILNQLYGSETQWAHDLPQHFTYSQLRDRLFAETHPKSEKLPVA